MPKGTAQLKLYGDKNLIRKLSSLEPKLQKKVLRQALRAGARPILDDAKRNVPKKTGALRKSLRIRAQKRRRNRIGVNVMTGAGFFKGDQFYGGFFEYGTSRMPARPFLRPAFDGQKTRALYIIWKHASRGVAQVAREKV